MLKDFILEDLNLVWNHEIKPLLKEYFFEDENEDKVKTCQASFNRIKGEIESQAGIFEPNVKSEVQEIDSVETSENNDS